MKDILIKLDGTKFETTTFIINSRSLLKIDIFDPK